jgi:uncharacterized protein DUF4255
MPLSAVESALQAWLREQLPLPAEIGDVSFDSPDVSWGDALTRPTVNLFLFDIARAGQQSVPMPPRRDQRGLLVQERPAPCVAFSYLLSTWHTDVREEHRLLGDAVRAVLSTPVLNTPVLSPELNQESEPSELVGPVMLGLSETNDVRARELWMGLGGRLHAGLVLIVTTAVPLGRPTPRATPVETVRAEVIVHDEMARWNDANRRDKVTARGSVGRATTTVAPATSAVPTETGATTAADPTAVEGSVLESHARRRYVWFGPRRQRGRGRP